MYMGRRYVKYSCCGNHVGVGANEGYKCGDHHDNEEEGIVGVIIFLMFVLGVAGCGIACGVACCYGMKCCCFAEQVPPPPIGGYSQPIGVATPQIGVATVVGQPVMAQPVVQMGVATPVMQATPVQATVVQATPVANPSEDNPNLQANSAYNNASGA